MTDLKQSFKLKKGCRGKHHGTEIWLTAWLWGSTYFLNKASPVLPSQYPFPVGFVRGCPRKEKFYD